MTHSADVVAIYLEVGKKRVLAGALDWPGWCRGGRDEQAALQTLIEYGPRYQSVLHATGIAFKAPKDTSALKVDERLEGNATTDFGAPDVAPSRDDEPVDDVDLQPLQELMKACWSALDAACVAAYGKDLRKGPRGGGRELAYVLGHVLDAEASYLSRLGGKAPGPGDGAGEDDALRLLRHPRVSAQREAILDTLGAAARGEVSPVGPRGGARWTPRFFVRRSAWHILDHAWEIEDRLL